MATSDEAVAVESMMISRRSARGFVAPCDHPSDFDPDSLKALAAAPASG